jgi:hypothetical protein
MATTRYAQIKQNSVNFDRLFCSGNEIRRISEFEQYLRVRAMPGYRYPVQI